jgi:hypothetical protein
VICLLRILREKPFTPLPLSRGRFVEDASLAALELPAANLLLSARAAAAGVLQCFSSDTFDLIISTQPIGYSHCVLR